MSSPLAVLYMKEGTEEPSRIVNMILIKAIADQVNLRLKLWGRMTFASVSRDLLGAGLSVVGDRACI
ncbi:hypothetical protein D3C77_706540 [compost metagenome]